jgi:hypothetical protein
VTQPARDELEKLIRDPSIDNGEVIEKVLRGYPCPDPHDPNFEAVLDQRIDDASYLDAIVEECRPGLIERYYEQLFREIEQEIKEK